MNTQTLRQVRALDVNNSGAQHCERQDDQESKAFFWYSKRTALFFLSAMILAVVPISSLTPPFQSPDEVNHIKRAYLLSKGHVFLDALGGRTGGNIDTGLLTYTQFFWGPLSGYEDKMTQNVLRDSRRITWSGSYQFSELANTAVYFPLSYTPQAIAFLIGEHIGLNISDTYYLARALSLGSTIAVLWVALTLYPVPLPVLALFATPMTLFQIGSASLDAISFAMCVLAASLFMRAADNRSRFSPLLQFALILCLLLLSTSRINLVGLIWLPLALYSTRHERSYLISSGVLIALSISWVIFVTLTVKGSQIQEISPGGILLYYLTHIYSFFSVMFSTLTNSAILLGYWNMFVGILGNSHEIPLDSSVYSTFAILLVVLSIVSAQTSKTILLDRGHVSLALGTALSTVLLFVLFLATCTLHPAKVVDAIQGRYFYPMAIFTGFVLFDRRMSPSRIRIGLGILFLMMTLSVVSTVPKLIGRYWAS